MSSDVHVAIYHPLFSCINRSLQTVSERVSGPPCVSTIIMLWFFALSHVMCPENANKKTEPQSIHSHTISTSVQLFTHMIYSISLHREASGCPFSGGSDGPVV